MTIAYDDRGLIHRVGPFEVDWPRAAGYFSAIGLAVVFDLIALPIGLFIAAIPVIKLFKRRGQPWPVRIVADALEGAAKPVGGDAEAMIRFAKDSAHETPGAPSNGRPRARSTLRKERLDDRVKRGRVLPEREV